MQRYVVERLLLVIPTVLGVTMLLFLVMRVFLPADVVDLMLAQADRVRDPELRQQLEEEYGLDRSIAVQYVSWLGDLAQGDLGNSLHTRRPVTDELQKRLPVTAELGFLALVISMVIALPVGVIAAIRQDTPIDYLLRGTAILILAVPGFWLALLVITYGARWFGWAPPVSYTSPIEDLGNNLKMMWLPALILGINLTGGVMRFTRTTLLEVLRQDYIRTAWAKGLRERTVVTRHALRNGLIPVVTIIGLELPLLIGGTVIIETVFNLPGVGRYVVDSFNQLDYPIAQGVTLLLALAVIFANLAVDIAYVYLDPRIRYR
jgi:peptide/nickel transport system permease protein